MRYKINRTGGPVIHRVYAVVKRGKKYNKNYTLALA